MKIRKLNIKNYKLFDNLELDFTDENGHTLDTIVLAGVNGSGKSTLLTLCFLRYWVKPFLMGSNCAIFPHKLI